MPYFGGPYAIYSVVLTDFYAIHCMTYFGGILFANMGGGGGQSYFHCSSSVTFDGQVRVYTKWLLHAQALAAEEESENS